MDGEKFRKLLVWQRAHTLVLDVYSVSSHFPKGELFGLTSQMRRSAVSVAANITEGCQRPSAKDRLHFHVMARTSLDELKYYIVLAMDLRYYAEADYERLMFSAREVSNMLYGLDRSIASALSSSPALQLSSSI